MNRTTLCYIEMAGKLLMLHRTKKKNDENADKYIGLGGHFLDGETPLECVKREVYEESGLTLENPTYRGIVHFSSDEFGEEEMHLFTDTLPLSAFSECDEGDLSLIEKEKLFSLHLWEGDLIFLSLLFNDAPFFDLSLDYKGEKLVSAALDGHPAELFDLLDENGNRTGAFKERSLVHRDGDKHATAHVWIYRKTKNGIELLLQKRAENKDSYPGCYDISSAGHLSRGEDYLPAAKRELFEELGISADNKDLIPIGFFDRKVTSFFSGKPFIDDEHSALYLYDGKDLKKDDFHIDKNELSEVRWFSSKELTDKVCDKSFCLNEKELALVLSAIQK